MAGRIARSDPWRAMSHGTTPPILGEQSIARRGPGGKVCGRRGRRRRYAVGRAAFLCGVAHRVSCWRLQDTGESCRRARTEKGPPGQLTNRAVEVVCPGRPEKIVAAPVPGTMKAPGNRGWRSTGARIGQSGKGDHLGRIHPLGGFTYRSTGRGGVTTAVPRITRSGVHLRRSRDRPGDGRARARRRRHDPGVPWPCATRW